MKAITTKITLEKSNTLVIIENVPAELDEVYGQEYFDEKVTENLLKLAETYANPITKVIVLDYLEATKNEAISPATLSSPS